MRYLSKVLLIMLAALLLLAACNGEEEEPLVNTEETEDEVDVEQPANESEADEEVVTLAEEFIGQLSEGQYEEAAGKFDETMADQLGAHELEELWDSLEEQLGHFIDYEYDATEAVNDYQIVLIKGVFNNTDATFQVTVDENQQIAGFYIQ